MPVHPIEFRYHYSEMYAVFTEDEKLQSLLDVETALAWAHAELGTIPKVVAEEIEMKAKVGIVKVERVKEIEEKIGHDLLAMVYSLQEVCKSDAGNYIHLGATSSDIEDTALALQLRRAINILESDIKILLKELLDKAEQHRESIFIGRIHGQHALPMTFGMKFALWAAEVARHLDRFEEVRKRILVGKMNGAIGTMASFGEKGFEVQRITMERLGLETALITNQILQRDRHAELQCLLALMACTLEKMGREVGDLQRTEIAELSETIQNSRSIMPHKQNLSATQSICNLARIIKGSVNASLESIALEHERDLSNSSIERINIPKGFILMDYILRQMTDIIKHLTLHCDKKDRNINNILDLILTERVIVALIAKGMDRQEGYELLQNLAHQGWIEKRPLRDLILENPKVSRLITAEEIDKWLDPPTHTGTIERQVDRVVYELRKRL